MYSIPIKAKYSLVPIDTAIGTIDMSSAPVSNPPALNESKSSRKKKAKAEAPKAASDLPAPSPSIDTTNGQPGVEQTINGVEGNYESPYIKELYKYRL